MTFQLDTSGTVATPYGVGGPNNSGHRDWSDLSPFAQGYVEALFAAMGPKDKNDRPLSIGSAVRLHTGQAGVVMGLFPTRLKNLNVMTGRDVGGTYGGWEVEAIAEDGCDWYCEAQREEMFGRVATTSGPYLAFSDLAPETLARILADCEASRHTADSGKGAAFWRMRQRGEFENFPPLTVQLGDDGKVRFA